MSDEAFWTRCKELFWLAVEEGPDHWRTFLNQACPGNLSLLREVEELVEKHFATTIGGSETRPFTQSLPPAVRDRFHVLSRLGAGTFGEVYKAHDFERAEILAVKVLRDQSARGLLAFKNEFRRVSPVNHPNIVRMYELFERDAIWMFSMEFVDGTNFYDFVRPNNCRSDQRLRRVLAQLAHGLHAFHGFDLDPGSLKPLKLVHRDLKPSNVLVTGDGTVKILDFGLTMNTAEDPQSSHTLAGTPAYISPEHLKKLPLTESSDWYSVGVMLYEVLTGDPPFKNRPLFEKLDHDPELPQSVVPDIPRDLRALCMGLLRRSPEERWGYEAVASCASSSPQNVRNPIFTTVPRSRAHFVGRTIELDLLQRAYSAISVGKPFTVHISGPSGIGKTSLFREFRKEIESADRQSMVFAGRCHQMESVRYKGLEDLVDQAFDRLRNLSRLELERFRSRNFTMLAQMFPVLDQLHHELRVGSVPLSTEVRRRALAALTDMFGWLAGNKPLVLAIDDLQWADFDTCSFLKDLIMSTDAPPLLLILIYREEDIGTPGLTLLRGCDDGKDMDFGNSDKRAHEITLGRLSETDALHLARSLVPGSIESNKSIQSVVEQTECNPFLIHQILYWMTTSDATADGLGQVMQISDVIKSRTEDLPPGEKHLLELVALAGQPTAAAIFKTIPGMDGFSSAQDVLLKARLLRQSTVGKTAQLDIYHGRIRTAVTARIDEKTARMRHRELADSLKAQGNADPERIFIHYEQARRLPNASVYALDAADHAARALAFHKADDLYGKALKYGEWTADVERSIYGKIGDVRSNLGRGLEAADAYLRAAEGAGAPQRMQWTAAAAGQLMRSGDIERGDKLVERILREARLSAPRNRALLLVKILWVRQRIRIRKALSKFMDRRFRRSKHTTTLTRRKLVQLDACWAAAAAIGMTDPLRGAAFSASYVLRSLGGEPKRLSLGLAMQAAQLCHTSRAARPKEVDTLLAEARALAEQQQDAHAIAFAKVTTGITAYLQGNWKTAYTECDQAIEMLQSRCTGVAWELTTAAIFSFIGRSARGEWAENRKRLPAILKDADARGDLYAKHSFRVLACTYLTHVAIGDSDTALMELQEDLTRWPYKHYSIHNASALTSEVDIALYRGEAAAAWEKLERGWSSLRRSQLLRLQPTYVYCIYARARAAVAMAAVFPRHSADEKHFLQIAERHAAALLRKGPAWSQGLVALVRCGIASFQDDLSEARRRLSEAAIQLEKADLPPLTITALYLRAAIDGREQDRAAKAWIEVESIANPGRFAVMFAPGRWPGIPS